MGSSRIVGFTRVCPWGHWVNPWLFGSLGFALVIIGFMRGRWIHLRSRWLLLGSSGVVGITRVPARVVGFIRGRWVRWGSRWGSLSLFGVVAFTRVRAGGRWVHSGSLGSSGCRWVRSGSPLGLLGSLYRWLDSCAVIGFIWVRTGGCWVHSRSLNSLRFVLGVVRLFRGC